MVKILIVDGYVDEPSCLGVPPYISPYPRYIFGAILAAETTASIKYLTIDQLRALSSLQIFLSQFDAIIIIAGMVVPGRYLSGYPMSPREAIDFFRHVTSPVKILCGPAARFGFGLAGGKYTQSPKELQEIFDVVVTGDPDIVVNQLIKENLQTKLIDPTLCQDSLAVLAHYSVIGSQVVTQHPNFPKYLLAEIETFRGCSRSIVNGCSFCSEPSKGPPRFRDIKDVVCEVETLYKLGVRHFRLGNQPCFFSYQAIDADREEFPRPNPTAIEKLLKGIHTVTSSIKTLHIDNANPGILARYPDECRRIAKTIIKYHTSGDVAALGVESVDPVVIKKNNLKASPDEVWSAIQLLNEVGSNRGKNGLPELLPGLNFICGLPGETKRSFRMALDFLQRLISDGLLVRRINIRQMLPIPGTISDDFGLRLVNRHQGLIRHFKAQVRTLIEQPLLQRLVPEGTIIKDVYTECYDGHLTLSRQLGSYPLLVGIPGKISLHEFMDVKIVGFGYRSVTAVPYPLNLNLVPKETLQVLPGIGEKRARRIIKARPITSAIELMESLDEPGLLKKIQPFLDKKLIH